MSTSASVLGPAAELSDVIARFPLVHHAKPPCRPLKTRIRRVHELAHQAGQRSNEALVRAGEAFNLAALILSDCGMPDLARTLCRQQFAIFQTGQPYDSATAKLALQPLINLGRLHIRAGEADAAYGLITAVFNAVKTRTEAVIDHETITFGGLIGTEDAQREVVRWLWTVLLSDATRALTRAGLWDRALTHVQQHNGVGRRLLDGRQVAIIAAGTTGDHHTATDLLTTSHTPTRWEQAVSACLSVLCRRLARKPANPHSESMVEQFLTFESSPDLAVFQTRLGLCLLDLIEDDQQAARLANAIAAEALESGDAYAAREALSHHRCHAHTKPAQSHLLTEMVTASGLGKGTLPTRALDDLLSSVKATESSLMGTLSSR